VIDVPWNLVVPTVDVHLVGFGNRFPNDFTLEMLAVLKRCKRIFAAPPIHAPDFGIPEMESLLPLYGPDKSRVKTYAEMVERVFTAASTDPPVAFATYGSAMVGTVATHRILAEAAERGLTVHVTNAVSSFDGIWADFNIEPFYGFEIWEASAFARLEIVPNVWANLLLPQAPIFDMREGLDLTTMSLRTSSSVADLRDHLLHFYPADHMVHYVRSGAGAGPRLVAADVESMPLRDLDHPGRQVGSTLLVPRAKTEPRAKLDFARPAPTAAPPG
jgi:uncharacterized protein YabN with tetrapyrrole methylase and pyrophosphatase domain